MRAWRGCIVNVDQWALFLNNPLIYKRILTGGRQGVSTVLALALLSLATYVSAASYVDPGKGDVIGRVQYTTVLAGDTLAKLARRFSVSATELQMANPDLDPKKPVLGARVTLPTRHVLPTAKRQGIVINLAEKRLYYYNQPLEGPALVSTFPVGLGPDARKIGGKQMTVEQRIHKPSWSVPKSVLARNASMPSVLPPGPKNPLGLYTMQLEGADCQIHGTNNPAAIGGEMPHGCISLYPEDIELLIRQTPKGTPVHVVNQAFKVGYGDGVMFFEVYKPLDAPKQINERVLVNRIVTHFPQQFSPDDWQRIKGIAEAGHGFASPVSRVSAAPKQRKRWQLNVGAYQDMNAAKNIADRIEQLGVPVALRDCDGKAPCQVVVGPFTDRTYMNDVAKRIRWISRIRAKSSVYQPESFDVALGQRMAAVDM